MDSMSSVGTSTFLDLLPLELLVEIFSLSSNPKLPLVCCYFHDVITSTSLFWSSVHIGAKQHTPEGPLYLSRHLERGAGRPLDVVIRDTSACSTALSTELWHIMSIQKERIRNLDIGTDSTSRLCGQILQSVLLSPLEPSSLPGFIKLRLTYEKNQIAPYQRALKEPHTILRPIASLFPALTTLVLPLRLTSIPFPETPLFSLKTLVLDGSKFFSCHQLRILHIAQLLARTPNLETFWCKDHRSRTNEVTDNLTPQNDPWGAPPVHYPVVLPKLTRMALAMPGLGYDLLHAIAAPELQDLHIDGIKDEEAYSVGVAWLHGIPELLREALYITAERSPRLRRLSLFGVYLTRDTWTWLLGCNLSEPPFPELYSIAVHQMQEIKDDVTNDLDNAMIEFYAQEGRRILRRFAYLGSEPPLRGFVLDQLIKSAVRRQGAQDVFELELDGFELDDQERDDMLSQGVRAIVHKEPTQRKNWWDLGRDIDPAEADSY